MAQDDSTETIGQRVAKYRRLEGWSAQKLADEAHLTRSVVTNIENGRRTDMTVEEMLSISAALRVPPAALLFPIDRPLQARFGEARQDGVPARVIDQVDWLIGADADFGDDEEAERFAADLEELDAVVLYPIGVTVWSAYGRAGRAARALIRAGRILGRAEDRVSRLGRDLRVLMRDAGVQGSDVLNDRVVDASTSGGLAGSPLAAELRSRLPADDHFVVDQLLRDLDAAVANLRDAQAQVRLLGGDPAASFRAMSMRAIMTLVQSSPHEPRATTAARGGMADGPVESPLRVYREEEAERVRRRYARRRAHDGGIGAKATDPAE